MRVKVVVVGSGIVGLATARALALRGDEVVVLDKEDGPSRHQSSRNSGVVHAGLSYAPGSLKARLAVRGARSIQAYAAQKDIAHQVCGKLVVAVDESEVPRLRALADRARANGVPVRMLGPAEAREVEPHVRCVRALLVETTGIIDYPAVCGALAGDISEAGGEIRLDRELVGAVTVPRGVQVETTQESVRADALVACAGLYADRVASLSGLAPEVRIVPFRGEYYELTPDRQGLVRGLIYPVPDPRFPFLGVHLTRGIHGRVHAGPNAVLALRREGYTWREVDATELWQALTWPGLWRLAAPNLAAGAGEVLRSLSRAGVCPQRVTARPRYPGRRPGARSIRGARTGRTPGRLTGRGLPFRDRPPAGACPQCPVPGSHRVLGDRRSPGETGGSLSGRDLT